MSGRPDSLFEARFICQSAKRQAAALTQVGRNAENIERFEGAALPLAYCAVANYRMALEYVAQAIARACCPTSDPQDVNFPIAKSEESWKSIMGRRFPGLRASNPGLWDLLHGYQPFTPSGLNWIATLHALWNHSKHIGLNPAGTGTSTLAVTIGRTGTADDVLHSYWLVYDETRPLHEYLNAIGPLIEQVISEVEGRLRK